MPEIQAVNNLPWQPGGRPPKYGYIYKALAKPGRWFTVTFETVEAAERAQDAIYHHARKQGWTVNTSIDNYRLGVRRVV